MLWVSKKISKKRTDKIRKNKNNKFLETYEKWKQLQFLLGLDFIKISF